MKLQSENVLIASFLGGLIITVSIILAYGLPSIGFVDPFDAMMSQGSANARAMAGSVQKIMAGYSLGNIVYPKNIFTGWIIISVFLGTASAVTLYCIGKTRLRSGSLKPGRWALKYGLFACFIALPTWLAALGHNGSQFAYSATLWSVGFAFAIFVFGKTADPKISRQDQVVK